MKRRFIAGFLAMAMCVSSLPVNVVKADTVEDELTVKEGTSENTETANGQFVILSTTDVHGKVWDKNILNDTTVNNSLLNASTAVKEYREGYGEDNVILLDNGDLYQGTPISSYNISLYTQKKTDDINPMARALAYMGYDAAILGNHEFNYPWATMSDIYDYLEDEGVATVCANLYYEESNERVFDPYLLKEVEVDGVKVTIGIIGLENTDCTRWDVAENYPGMIFASKENTKMDLSYEVQKVQNEWKDAGIDPDFVLVCYHGALESEMNATSELVFASNSENQVRRIITNTTGIDMVISGHDHNSSYSNTFVENKAGENVLVVNGGGTDLTASVWNVSVNKETGEASLSLGEVVNQDLSEAVVETEAVNETTEAAAAETEAVSETTEAVAVETEAVSETTEAAAAETEAVNEAAVVAETEAVSETTEAVAAETEAAVAETEAVVETEAVKAFSEEASGETTKVNISLESSVNVALKNYAIDEGLQKIIEPYVTVAENYVNTSVGNLLNWDGKRNSSSKYFLEQTDTVDLINRAEIAMGSTYLNDKYASVDELNAKLKDVFGNDTTKQLSESALINNELVVDLACTSVVTSSYPAAGDSELTMKGIYGFYKYDNSLYLYAATGAEIKELLEYNASDRIVVKFKDGKAVFTDTGDYNANFTFPVFYGLNYTIDMSKEAGNRVEITDFSNGKAFDLDTVYIIGINNYHSGNSYNTVLGKYPTENAIWSQTDDLGGGYVQDLIASYVKEKTEANGGVYNSAQADKNGEGLCSWSITYTGEIPTEIVISDNTAYVGGLVKELKAGDQIMMQNVANAATISNEYYSADTPTLSGVTAVEKDETLYAEANTAIFTVGVTDEGYYTFKTEAGYLTSKSTGSGLGYEAELNEYGLWTLETTEDANVFYIKNVNASYGGYSAQYIEYYFGKFTTYGLNGGGDPYGFSFYNVKTAGAEVKADALEDGDSLIVYYNNGESVLGPVNGNKLSAVAASKVATESGASLVVPNDGATVFKVGVTKDGKYSFSTEEGYLTYSKGLTYSETLTDEGLWTLEETADGYYFIRNVGADDQYLEYYSGFTTYKKFETSDASVYTFTLYKVGAVASVEKPEVEGYTLSVFETSDVHGYLLDSSSGKEETYQYRLAYIADKVNDAREENGKDNVILIDSGDIYQGNVISNLQNGQPMTAAYDLMGYDAVSIGNHEFDWGYETVIDADGTMSSYSVGDYKGDSKVPVLVSNIYKDGEKVTFAQDYVILERTALDKDGNEITVKVGVIGFVDEYSSDIMAAQFTGRGFTVKEDYEALEALAVTLETEKDCDATIVLCHADAGKVAGSLSKTSVIDLVCGGHSHVSQSGTSGSVTYVEPSNQAATYGYAELVFQTNDQKEISEVAVSATTVSVTGDKTKLYDTEENADDLDADIVALSKASVENVSDVLNEKLGYITTSVTKTAIGENIYSSTAGNWMTSLIARAVGAEVGFTNNGGIRTTFELEEGADFRSITTGDIYTISPFCNIIYAYEITYAELLTVMEYAIGSGASLGLRMSGIDCYYSNGAVTALVLNDGTLIYQNGTWFNGYDTKTVKVATNEYVATSETPFKAWNDTEKLYSNTIEDNAGQIAAVKAEAAQSGGYLYVDAKAHMINGEYQADHYTHEHDYSFVKTEAPTCTEEGYTIHVCEACGASYKTDIVAATGHNYVNGVCENCGHKEGTTETPDRNVYTPSDFKEALEQGDIVIENNNVTITFKKGSALNLSVAPKYDFNSIYTTEFAGLNLPAHITKDNFIAKIDYAYTGTLPATASIEIFVGTEYAGKIVCYSMLNANGTVNKDEIQMVTVDENGYITVEQTHCSSYVITTVYPIIFPSSAPTTEIQSPSASQPQTGVSPKTGTAAPAAMFAAIGFMGAIAVLLRRRKQA